MIKINTQRWVGKFQYYKWLKKLEEVFNSDKTK